MKIRDLRNGEWFWVNNAVMRCPHISDADFKVYSVLASFGGMPEIRPTKVTISQRGNISLRQIKYSVKKLIEVGYVEVAQGGGRGWANTYNLLKAVRGCNVCIENGGKDCPDNKGGKESAERGQNTTVKGATTAPHKDIYKNKEKDTAPETGADEIGAFIKLFGGINPSYGELFKRKPQRAAADKLLKLHPLSWWVEFMTGYVGVLEDRFCPRATTPQQMEDKLAAIMVYGRQRKADSLKTKQKIWV